MFDSNCKLLGKYNIIIGNKTDTSYNMVLYVFEVMEYLLRLRTAALTLNTAYYQ